jgi:hypothetical protein
LQRNDVNLMRRPPLRAADTPVEDGLLRPGNNDAAKLLAALVFTKASAF